MDGRSPQPHRLENARNLRASGELRHSGARHMGLRHWVGRRYLLAQVGTRWHRWVPAGTGASGQRAREQHEPSRPRPAGAPTTCDNVAACRPPWSPLTLKTQRSQGPRWVQRARVPRAAASSCRSASSSTATPQAPETLGTAESGEKGADGEPVRHQGHTHQAEFLGHSLGAGLAALCLPTA